MNKILLIDDEETTVRVLSMSLRADGYQVETAFSGEEGLEIFTKASPEVVITDVKMPGMDGIEVLKRIRALTEEPEVIIITGHGDIENAIEALKHGASDFITKPIRDEALSIALQRALEKIGIKRKLKAYTRNLEKEVRNATRELRRQSSFLSKVITSSSDGILATDEDFTVVIFNPGAERIFGYTEQEVIGKAKALDLYSPELANIFREVAAGRRGMRDLAPQETQVLSKEGSAISVRFHGSFLYESQKLMGSVAFFQDLREIKRLEKELVRSERLAAIGKTVAGVAHDIKNVLHGFKGGSYLVNMGISKGDNEKLKNGWEIIQKNIGRTSDLVMDMLSYSKFREPEYEPCMPNTIAGDVCELMQTAAEEHQVGIVMEFDTAIGEVMMDPQTVHRCLLNLMSNAVDACIDDTDDTKKHAVRLKTAFEAEGLIRFEVTDNGVGMSQEVKRQLFSSFFSTKGHRGTGLGLLVTKKLVEEHKGTIEVFSEPGRGTRFVIRLPFKLAG